MFIHVYQEAMLLGISMYLPHMRSFMRMFVHVYQEAMLLGISMYLPHNAVLHEDVRSCLPGSGAAQNLNVSSTHCGPS